MVERDPFQGQAVAVHHDHVQRRRAFVLVDLHQADDGGRLPFAPRRLGSGGAPVGGPVCLLHPGPVPRIAVHVDDQRLAAGADLFGQDLFQHGDDRLLDAVLVGKGPAVPGIVVPAGPTHVVRRQQPGADGKEGGGGIVHLQRLFGHHLGRGIGPSIVHRGDARSRARGPAPLGHGQRRHVAQRVDGPLDDLFPATPTGVVRLGRPQRVRPVHALFVDHLYRGIVPLRIVPKVVQQAPVGLLCQRCGVAAHGVVGIPQRPAQAIVVGRIEGDALLKKVQSPGGAQPLEGVLGVTWPVGKAHVGTGVGDLARALTPAAGDDVPRLVVLGHVPPFPLPDVKGLVVELPEGAHAVAGIDGHRALDGVGVEKAAGQRLLVPDDRDDAGVEQRPQGGEPSALLQYAVALCEEDDPGHAHGFEQVGPIVVLQFPVQPLAMVAKGLQVYAPVGHRPAAHGRRDL